MGRRPPRSTRADTLLPYTTRFRSAIDAIDRKLLRALQADSRLTMQELADRVGLSVSPCHRRVKLLEERGVRSEEHTSELQSLMRISYAVFCLTNTKNAAIIHPSIP